MNETEMIEAQASLLLDPLRKDHQKVKRLFEEFASATDGGEKHRIADRALKALQEHSYVEEKVLYPAFAPVVDEERVMERALEEHHVVHLLITELKKMPAGDSSFDATFSVLAENVTHHIEEEEGDMFTQVGEADFDWVDLSEKAEAARRRFSARPAQSDKQNGRMPGKKSASSFRTSTTSVREAN